MGRLKAISSFFFLISCLAFGQVDGNPEVIIGNQWSPVSFAEWLKDTRSSVLTPELVNLVLQGCLRESLKETDLIAYQQVQEFLRNLESTASKNESTPMGKALGKLAQVARAIESLPLGKEAAPARYTLSCEQQLAPLIASYARELEPLFAERLRLPEGKKDRAPSGVLRWEEMVPLICRLEGYASDSTNPAHHRFFSLSRLLGLVLPKAEESEEFLKLIHSNPRLSELAGRLNQYASMAGYSNGSSVGMSEEDLKSHPGRTTGHAIGSRSPSLLANFTNPWREFLQDDVLKRNKNEEKTEKFALYTVEEILGALKQEEKARSSRWPRTKTQTELSMELLRRLLFVDSSPTAASGTHATEKTRATAFRPSYGKETSAYLQAISLAVLARNQESSVRQNEKIAVFTTLGGGAKAPSITRQVYGNPALWTLLSEQTDSAIAALRAIGIDDKDFHYNPHAQNKLVSCIPQTKALASKAALLEAGKVHELEQKDTEYLIDSDFKEVNRFRPVIAHLGQTHDDPKVHLHLGTLEGRAVPATIDGKNYQLWTLGSALLQIPHTVSSNQEWREKIESDGGLGFGAFAELAPADLLKALNDSDWKIRRRAVSALPYYEKDKDLIVPELTKAMKDTSTLVRRAAALALQSLGARAVEATETLVRALEDTDVKTSNAAKSTLIAIGPRAAPAVVTALLKNGRRTTAEVAGELGESASEAIPKLVEMKSPALAGMGAKAVPFLMKALEDKEGESSSFALEILAKLGSHAKEAIPQLAKKLEDKSGYTSEAAAKALAAIGDAAIPTLEKAFGSESPEIRKAATQAFGHLGEAAERHLPQLSKAMGDADTDVRGAAVGAFRRIGEKALPYLVKILEDKDFDSRGRQNSAIALSSFGPKALPILRKALEDSDPLVRSRAANSLSVMGAPARAALPDLFRSIHDSNKEVRKDVIDALGKLGDETTALPLAKALEDSDAEIKGAAASSLLRLGVHSAPAMKALSKAIADPESRVRRGAAFALDAFGEKAAPVSDDLASHLKNSNPEIRRFAAKLLGNVGTPAKSHAPALVSGIVSGQIEPDIGGWAVGKMGNEAVESLAKHIGDPKATEALGSTGEKGVPYLLKALGSEKTREIAVAALRQTDEKGVALLVKELANVDEHIRQGAARALASRELSGVTANSALDLAKAVSSSSDPKIRSAAMSALINANVYGRMAFTADFVPHFKKALRDPDKDSRRWAARMLGELKGNAIDAVEELTEALDDTDTSVREEAASVLLNFAPSAHKALPKMAAAVNDKSSSLAYSAIAFLGKNEKGIAILMHSLLHSDKDRRGSVARALQHAGRTAVPSLAKALNDKDVGIRQAVAGILAEIGQEAYAAIPELARALSDTDPAVRRNAATALGAIGTGARGVLPVLRSLSTTETNEEVRTRATEAVRLIEHGIQYRTDLEDR